MILERADEQSRGSDACKPRLSGAEVDQVPWYVRAFALGIPAYLLGVHFWTWVFNVRTFLAGHADFRQLFAAACMVRTGHARELYDYSAQFYYQNFFVSKTAVALPFIRPAYEALLFIPFTFVSYRAAYLGLIAANLLLLALCYVLLRPKMNNLEIVYRWLPAAIFLGYLPVAAALIQGQDSILFLTLLCLAAHALDRHADFTAGVLVGIGLFKPQIAIPIAVLFLAWRRWRFAAGFATAAAWVTTISIWLTGWHQSKLLARTLFSAGITQPSGNNFQFPVRVEMMANLHGLLYGLAPARWQSWVPLMSVAGSVVTLLVVAFIGRRKKCCSDALVLAIAASAFASHYLFMHDMTVLLLALVVTLNRFLPAEQTGDRRGRSVARTSALLFVAPVSMSFIPSHFYLAGLTSAAFLAALLWQARRDRQGEIRLVSFGSDQSCAVPV